MCANGWLGSRRGIYTQTPDDQRVIFHLVASQKFVEAVILR
jgi:hypothetical protein